MTQVCKQCKHLMSEGADQHACPTPEYQEAHRSLVSAAAEFEEMGGEEIIRAMSPADQIKLRSDARRLLGMKEEDE